MWRIYTSNFCKFFEIKTLLDLIFVFNLISTPRSNISESLINRSYFEIGIDDIL